MADNVWFYNTAAGQRGPVSFQQLQQVAASGQIGPDDWVWQQGTEGWVAAKTVEGLLPPPTAPVPPPPAPPAEAPPAAAPAPAEGAPRARRSIPADLSHRLPHLRLIGALLDLPRKLLSESFLGWVDSTSKLVGHLAYICVAALIFLLFAMLAIRAKSATFFLIGLCVIPIAAILQYVATLFLDAGKTLIEKSPSQVSSRAFLDCYGLVALVGALAALIGLGIVGAIQGGGLPAFAIGVGAFLVLTYAGGMGLNPGAVNVAIGEETSAGEEAISIQSFLVKVLFLRLAPFIFGVGSVVGCLVILYFLFQTFGGGWMGVAMMGMPIVMGVLGLALVPFAFYLLFLLSYLWLDVIRAVLVVPRKLEKLIAVEGGTADDSEDAEEE